MNFLRAISALDITAIIGYLSPLIALIVAFAEKKLGKNLVGAKWFLSIVWRVVKYFGGKFIQPWKEEIEKAKKYLFPGHALARQLEAIKTDVGYCKGELSFNGGNKTSKDLIKKLIERDEKDYQQMLKFREEFQIVNTRLDIQDEAVGRFSFRLNRDLSCTFISPNYLRYFGYAKEDVIGDNWDFCIAENQKLSARAEWERAVKRRARYKSELILIDSKDNERICYVRGLPLIDAETNELTGFYGTIEILEEVEVVN